MTGPSSNGSLWKRNWPSTRKHFEQWWEGTGLVLGAWGTGLPLENESNADRRLQSADSRSAIINQQSEIDAVDPQRRHTDAAYIARNTRYKMSRRAWPADILPAAWPHIGTLPLAAYLGATPEYAPNNVWYHPCMDDIEQHPLLEFDPDAPRCRELEGIVRETARLAEGNYFIGMPALLGGVDVLAELRGTSDLLMDMIENPDAVHARLRQIQRAYEQAFVRMYEIVKLDDGSMAFSYFMLYGPGKTGLCQCDTASMFSPQMFAEFVVPYLREQCAFLDRSMFHIDGSQCLAHLDMLLGIDDLDAIEYTPDPKVPGGGDPQWYDLYQRILQGGKSVWVANLRKHEVIPLLDTIGGKGVYVSVNGLMESDAEKLASAVEPYRS